MSEYYDHTTYPAAGVKGQSAAMRAELELIDTGFAKLPTLAGNGSKAVVINSLGTALAVTVGTLALAGNLATTGAYNTTFVQQASTSITLPTTNSVMARTDAAQTFTGVQTFSSQPILSSLTASQVVFTDGSKGLISGTQTGTGTKVVVDTGPTLVTPTLGVATATSINKVAITAPATSATLTIADGKTLTQSKTMQFTAADDTGVYTFPTGTKTLVATDGNVATATALATPRAIYGNNFDGTAALTQIIASTYGGTGNGFTKFSGPTTAERTFTLPDSSATLLYSGGDAGTPSALVATNLTGTAAGLTAGVASAVAASGITGTTLAAGVVTSSLTTVGALNSGSITSGFGSIDVGADAISGGAISGTGTITQGAGNSLWTRTTKNVQSVAGATLIVTGIQYANEMVLVYGVRSDSGPCFFDQVVLDGWNGTFTVWNSSGSGSPDTRTYSYSGGNLYLAMSAGTYRVNTLSVAGALPLP